MFAYLRHTISQYKIKHLFVRFAEEYIWWILKYLPGFEGMILRYLFLKCTTKQLKGFCYISQGCTITNSYGISIGKNFAANRNVILDGTGGIEIGDGTGFGPNCVLLSHEHTMLTKKSYFVDQDYKKRPVRIGANVWIASNCFIKAGVTIGDNAVVASCSHVIEDIAENERVIGVPARAYFKVMREYLKE